MSRLVIELQNSDSLIGYMLRLSKYLFILAYLIQIYPLSLLLLVNAQSYQLNLQAYLLLLAVNTQVYPKIKIDFSKDSAQQNTEIIFGADVSRHATRQQPEALYSNLGLSSSFACNTAVSLV